MPTAKTDTCTAQIDPALKQALRIAAALEYRSLSNTLEVMVCVRILSAARPGAPGCDAPYQDFPSRYDDRLIEPAMADLIENPVINLLFGEPQRYFRFEQNGITHEILTEWRLSTYCIPMAKPKLKGAQKVRKSRLRWI